MTLAKLVIVDFYRLLQLIIQQILSIIEYYLLINYIFDDRFRLISYTSMNLCPPRYHNKKSASVVKEKEGGYFSPAVPLSSPYI